MGTFQHEVRTNYCKKLLFVVSLQKKSSTRQFESKLSLRSFAFSLKKKSCISAKYLSKLNILHSICIFFAPSTNESAQGASQEASITTKVGHNRRQAPVIYYDPKRALLQGRQTTSGNQQDTRHKGCNKCPNYFLRSASPADKGPATRIGETTGRTQHINHHLTVIFQSLVISHFRFSKYKNLKLFCLQQPLVIILKQDDYDTNGARRVAFRHHHIESLGGFASIYTPTLIFLSHCCFSFSCRKYTTFFFSSILFGHFFSKKFRKRSQGV